MATQFGRVCFGEIDPKTGVKLLKQKTSFDSDDVSQIKQLNDLPRRAIPVFLILFLPILPYSLENIDGRPRPGTNSQQKLKTARSITIELLEHLGS